MIILVCGGRDYCDWNTLSSLLDSIHQEHNIECLIQGKANGADWLARAWAISRNVPFKDYPANWKKYGKAAGLIRNTLMLDDNPAIDCVVAFAGGAGTANMMEQANSRNILVLESE